LIADLPTPLRENGNIDGRGLGRLLDRILPHVNAVFVVSPYLGEGQHFDSEKRAEILEKALVVIRGKVPLFVWITQNNGDKTHNTLEILRKRVSEKKYSGSVVWVDTPLYYHSNRGLPIFYRDLTSIEGSSFLIHNDPDLIKARRRPLKRTNIRTAILNELSMLEHVKGIVFLGPLGRAHNYQKAVRHRRDFRIYDGDETHFLRHPSLHGVVSAGANLAPRVWQKITQSSLASRNGQDAYPDHLRQVWRAGDVAADLMASYTSQPVPFIKTALNIMGLIETPTCMDKMVIPKSQTERIQLLLSQYAQDI
jgi:dihydrodipicolinate synthase/N-acetylneuraminate lyase